jgi:hypothetical protein
VPHEYLPDGRHHAEPVDHPSQLTREHVVVNVSPGVRKPLVELFPLPQKGALERPTPPDDSSRRFLRRSRARTSAAPTPLRLETLLEASPQDESNRLPAEVAVNALMSLGERKKPGRGSPFRPPAHRGLPVHVEHAMASGLLPRRLSWCD